MSLAAPAPSDATLFGRRSSTTTPSASKAAVPKVTAHPWSGRGPTSPRVRVCREAVEGVDAVIHAASDPRKPQAVDVAGSRRLVEAAREAGTGHFIYVSIVGVDKIPFGYYRAKAEAERLVAESGAPYSILRATQFHSFVNQLIRSAARVPLVLPLPTDFRVQSVAAEEVAARLVRALDGGPGGRLPDFGGPEVMTLGEAAGKWKEALNVQKPVVNVPLFGGLAAGFRAGHNTVPEGERGTVRWEAWLRAGGSSR